MKINSIIDIVRERDLKKFYKTKLFNDSSAFIEKNKNKITITSDTYRIVFIKDRQTKSYIPYMISCEKEKLNEILNLVL